MQPKSSRTWKRKLGDALRGAKIGARGQSSFFVHFFAAAAVVTAAAILQCRPWQWSLLLLCITLVLAIEMCNSSLEAMARAVNRDHDPHLRDALDIGSAAVLVASAGAAVVGGVVFLNRLGELVGWW